MFNDRYNSTPTVLLYVRSSDSLFLYIFIAATIFYGSICVYASTLARLELDNLFYELEDPDDIDEAIYNIAEKIDEDFDDINLQEYYVPEFLYIVHEYLSYIANIRQMCFYVILIYCISCISCNYHEST